MAVVLIYDGFSCPDRVCAEQPSIWSCCGIGDAVNFVYINDGDRLAQALEPKNNPLLQGPKLQTPKLQTPNIQSSPSVQECRDWNS
jgi:hypothetical protein